MAYTQGAVRIITYVNVVKATGWFDPAASQHFIFFVVQPCHVLQNPETREQSSLWHYRIRQWNWPMIRPFARP